MVFFISSVVSAVLDFVVHNVAKGEREERKPFPLVFHYFLKETLQRRVGFAKGMRARSF